MTKKKARPKKRMLYKYPHARNFFANLASTHSVEEIEELLIAGVEFLNLGMVKI